MLWVVGIDGCGSYMYTLVLDAESYGVFIYPMCNNIMCANLCFILSLFRTSCLILWDSLVLSDQLWL